MNSLDSSDHQDYLNFLAGRQDLRGVDVVKDWRLIMTPKEIEYQVKRCAKIIDEKFAGKNVIVVNVLKGATYFFVDLTRELTIPYSSYHIEASSYHDKQTQTEQVKLSSEINPDKFKGKDVILLDELYDNGNTLENVRQLICTIAGVPLDRIFTCTAFRKNKHTTQPQPDLYGITVPDVWLVGYGLDDKQEKRGWPYLVACPKEDGVPKTNDDAIFTNDVAYAEMRKNL